MNESSRRAPSARKLMGAGVILALVWIGVYWATPSTPGAAQGPAIVFAEDRAPAEPPPITIAQSTAIQAPVVDAPVEPSQSPPVAAVQRAPAVIPPAFREHTVRANETMETIARSQLGDAALWTAVASANPRVDPLKLRVGQTIRIPLDPANIQGVPNPEVAPERPAREPDEPVRIEYTVRRGDTLGAIARTYYNSSSRWQIILDANRDKIDRPEDIRPGMTLVIPPAPPSD